MQNGSGPEPAETGPDLAETGPEPAETAPGLQASLEAIILVADEPVSEVLIAQVLERPRAEVAGALRELADSYTAEQRGCAVQNRFNSACAPRLDRRASG